MRIVGLVVIGLAFGIACGGTAKNVNQTAAGPAQIRIEVNGAPRTRFTGAIGNAGSQHSVQGITPETFTVDGDSVVAVIQNSGTYRPGGLSVILHGCPDGIDHMETTSADYGVVTVSC